MPPKGAGSNKKKATMRQPRDMAKIKEQRARVQLFNQEFGRETKKFTLQMAVANFERDNQRKTEAENVRRQEREVDKLLKSTEELASSILHDIKKKIEKSKNKKAKKVVKIPVTDLQMTLSQIGTYIRSVQRDMVETHKLQKMRSRQAKDTTEETAKIMQGLDALENATRAQLNEFFGYNNESQNAAQPWLQPGFGGVYPPGNLAFPPSRNDPVLPAIQAIDADLASATPEEIKKREDEALARLRDEERKQRKILSPGFVKDDGSKIMFYLIGQQQLQNEGTRCSHAPIEEFRRARVAEDKTN
jgi:hypothetical protein